MVSSITLFFIAAKNILPSCFFIVNHYNLENRKSKGNADHPPALIQTNQPAVSKGITAARNLPTVFVNHIRRRFFMKKIFEPVRLNNLVLKNRLVRSATWEGIANPDGSVTKEAYAIYQELAKGGAGAIITGFTSVSSDDFYFGGMMRLSDDALIPQYKTLTDIIHKEGCPVITQLALGAYYRPLADGRFRQAEPDDMEEWEIQHVIKQFVQAAVRAEKAGFDGVQIHAAHFFFLSRFISPFINHRNDEYGGSTENRIKLVLEILDGIKKAVPSLHVTVKINSSDFHCKGTR